MVPFHPVCAARVGEGSGIDDEAVFVDPASMVVEMADDESLGLREIAVAKLRTGRSLGEPGLEHFEGALWWHGSIPCAMDEAASALRFDRTKGACDVAG